MQFFKLKKGVILLILMASCAMRAQLADSISVNTSTFYQGIEDNLYHSPLSVAHLHLNDFTATGILFQHKNLGIRRVQSPALVNTYQFQTHGIYNISPKLRLFGKFKFDKYFEQNVKYNLSSERTEQDFVLTPNYFYAPKGGDWENQSFHLKGGLSYKLTHQLWLGAVIQYKNKESYRTIDPRPRIKIAEYAGQFHLGYQFKKHLVSLKAGAAVNRLTGNIMYVDDSQNAPAYPQTFTRFSSGYGRSLFNSSYPNYLTKDDFRLAGLAYRLKGKEYSFFTTYDYQRNTEKFYHRTGTGYVFYDEENVEYKYRNTLHKFRLNYYLHHQTNRYHLRIGYKNQKGENFSVRDQGQNFQSKENHYSLHVAMLKQNDQRLQMDASFQLNYLQKEFIDLLGYTHKKINAIDLKTQINRDLYQSTQHTFNLGVLLEAYLPVKDYLETRPLAEDATFIEEVVMPDHAFDITSYIQPGLTTNYTLKFQEKWNIRFFVNYRMMRFLDNSYRAYFSGNHNQYVTSGFVITY